MTAKTIFFILLAFSLLQKEIKKDKERDKARKGISITIENRYQEILPDKIKKFILLQNKRIDEKTAEEIATNIVNFCSQYDVDAKLITALIARESRFNPNIVSSSGAQGLGQLLPSTAKEVGVEDPFEISQNVRGTVVYFKKMLDMWKNHSHQTELALASYRIGHRVVKQYNDIPPIPEVQEFIEDIKQIYGKIE